jgi:DNA replicative helicase MCM subunit Mcm2 (Cdc46/Mcm family)
MEYGEAVSEFEEFFSERYYEEVDKALRDGEDSIVVDFQAMDAFNFQLSEFLKENPSEGVSAAEEGVK